jgi:hypothetical protein
MRERYRREGGLSSLILQNFCVGAILVRRESRQLAKPDGMRRPVSERDAVRSQVIDALEAQEIKETGNEEG